MAKSKAAAAAQLRQQNPRDLHSPSQREALAMLGHMDITSMTDGSIRYVLPEEGYRVLRRFVMDT
jgi:hypothetical protein